MTNSDCSIIDDEKPKEERDEQSSYISPFLPFVYDLIVDPLVTKYRLRASRKFWYVLSFTIVSIITILAENSILIPGLFGGLTLCILIVDNKTLIWDTISTKKTKISSEFVCHINDKQISDVKRFLNYYRYYLDPQEIIRIVDSKHKTNLDLYGALIHNQRISSEIIDFFVSHGFLKIIPSDLLCQLLKEPTDDISIETFNMIYAVHKNTGSVVKTLQVCFPLHIDKQSLLLTSAKCRNTIRDYFNYGAGLRVIIIISLLIAFLLSIYLAIFIGSSPSANGTFSFTIFLFIIMFYSTSFVFIVLSFMIKAILRVWRFLLILIVPSKIPEASLRSV